MSIIRWGEFGSEVYVFGSNDGWEILGGDPHIQVFPTIQTCKDRLIEMRAEGYCVPQEAFDRFDKYTDD